MFTELNKMMVAGQSISMEIFKTSTNMTVNVLPRDNGIKDEAVKRIKALVISGTPEELDEQFLNTILAPVSKASGILSNIKEFEDAALAAKNNSTAEKEKSEKIGKLLKAAEKYEEEKNPKAALDEYKKILEFDTNHAKATKRIAELDIELKQGSLF